MVFLLSVTAACLAILVPTTALDVSSTLQTVLSNPNHSLLYTYPTDLTRGIIPVSVFSAASWKLYIDSGG